MEELKVIKEKENLSMFTFQAENELEKANLTIEDLELLGAADDEIIQNIKDNFQSVQTESNLIVNRELTTPEIEEARERNIKIIEVILPDHQDEFDDTKHKADKMVRESRALVNSFITESKELAKYVRHGLEEINLDAKDVYRIAVNGYFVHLLINDGIVKPVKVVKISESDLEKWYTKQDEEKSRIFFNQLKKAK